MRDGKLHQIDRGTFQASDISGGLGDDPVIAVGKITNDQSGAVDAANRRDGQRVHIGHDGAVKCAGRELVDAFDIVVDLYDLDGDPIFIRPLVDDPLIRSLAPGHPANIDRPGDAEIGSALSFRFRER